MQPKIGGLKRYRVKNRRSTGEPETPPFSTTLKITPVFYLYLLATTYQNVLI